MTKTQHRLTEKNLGDFTATCLQCGPIAMRYRKDRNRYFCPNSSSATGYRCGTRFPHPIAVVDAARQEFTAKQNGRCAICGKSSKDSERTFALDHCHQSGKLRGILCHNCNVGLGNFRDDPTLLLQAVEYLRASLVH